MHIKQLIIMLFIVFWAGWAAGYAHHAGYEMVRARTSLRISRRNE